MASDLSRLPEGRERKRWLAGWERSEMIFFARFVTRWWYMDWIDGRGELVILEALFTMRWSLFRE